MQTHLDDSPLTGFLAAMQDRGTVRQCTDIAGLGAALQGGGLTAYVGFDATADSLHVGHLVSLAAMRRLAADGHRVIALLGGATTLVGDPSFRNATRPMLTETQVEANIAGIKTNIEAVIGEHADRLTFVDNREWLGGAGMIDFMRAVGSHFTVSRMLSMDSVKGRLEAGHPMTMLEFSYMLLQAADFLELSRREGCRLQMGGSDQWGNICNGIELARRADGRELFGLTTPLLENAAGEKMGKTASGAVWLSPDRLSPFDFWQFWRNVDDADVGRFLALFTDLPVSEARRLGGLEGKALNEGKAILATQVTAMVHGEESAIEARRKAETLFSGSPGEVTHEIEAEGEVGLLEALLAIGFAASKGEARRLIRGNGVKLDGVTLGDEAARLPVRQEPYQLRAGKRQRASLLVYGLSATPTEVGFPCP